MADQPLHPTTVQTTGQYDQQNQYLAYLRQKAATGSMTPEEIAFYNNNQATLHPDQGIPNAPLQDLTNFGNQQYANVLNPVRLGQAEQGYNNANFGLDRQSDFMSALRGQAGVQNQSLIFAQQQALANQLQGVANGTGPNPALAQYQQATGQNINAQAALMAGQRGAGANAGLLSRQIGMQGGALQQQAAGQSAVMQAQQQLAGMSALQGQQAQLANTSGQMVNNLATANTGYSQAAQSEQQALLSAIGQQNNANVAMQSNVNSANARLAEVGMNNAQANQTALIGAAAGLAGGVASGIAGAYNGGMIERRNYACGGMAYADGGEVAPQALQDSTSFTGEPQSFVGKFLTGSKSEIPAALPVDTENARTGIGPSSGGMSIPWGTIGAGIAALAAKDGGKVPGQASVPGNNIKNDTVPAVLSPGEIVIPRSITTHPNAPAMAAQFVAHVLSRKRPQ